MIELPRAASARRRDRRNGRVLLVRHQRSDPDHARHLARRRGHVPGALYAKGHPAGGPVHHARSGGRRRTGADRGRARPRRAARPQARHLRRARRRSGLDRASARRSGSTTCPARPSACRSRVSRRRRRRSAARWRVRPEESAAHVFKNTSNAHQDKTSFDQRPTTRRTAAVKWARSSAPMVKAGVR